MTNEKDKSKTDKFLHQLIDIKPEDITLKFVFDNIRNYGIAAMVMVAGFYLSQHGAANPFHNSGIFFGILLVLAGFVIYVLNVMQAVWALVKLKMRMVPYFILSMIIFLGTSELLWVLIKQHMQKS